MDVDGPAVADESVGAAEVDGVQAESSVEGSGQNSAATSPVPAPKIRCPLLYATILDIVLYFWSVS